jgi:type 1 glutamine amidotransferase
MTNALYLYGGWPGHRPYDIADWTRDLVGELGFDLEESQDIFTLDRDLSGYDLIILGWNNALTTEDLSDSQEDHLLAWQPGTGRLQPLGRACAIT